MTTRSPSPDPYMGADREKRPSRFRTPLFYGTVVSLLSILCYGSGQVISRSLLSSGETPPQIGSAITLLVGMILLGALSSRNLPKDIRAPKRALAWIALAGILASTGAFLSFFALALAPIVLISPILAVSPLMTLLLAAIFLRQVEKVTARVVLGSSLVIVGVLLVILGNQ